MKSLSKPNLGYGLGFRTRHAKALLTGEPELAWLEIISENFMVDGGRPLALLDEVLERYTVVQHGVSMNIGGPGNLDLDYLKKLKRLVNRTRTPWITDHLCWTGTEQNNLHDLLPLPYTDEAIDRVTTRIAQVKDFLETPFALENVSSYIEFADSTMTEWEFLCAVAEEADCGILLDVNNVYVSARNHGFSPYKYISAVNPERVFQYHIAGHSDFGTHCIDTHDAPVCDAVWDLFRFAVEKIGERPTLLEWDSNIPPYDEALAEIHKAKNLLIREEEPTCH